MALGRVEEELIFGEFLCLNGGDVGDRPVKGRYLDTGFGKGRSINGGAIRGFKWPWAEM